MSMTDFFKLSYLRLGKDTVFLEPRQNDFKSVNSCTVDVKDGQKCNVLLRKREKT
jgi:hypothetical protein